MEYEWEDKLYESSYNEGYEKWKARRENDPSFTIEYFEKMLDMKYASVDDDYFGKGATFSLCLFVLLCYIITFSSFVILSHFHQFIVCGIIFVLRFSSKD